MAAALLDHGNSPLEENGTGSRHKGTSLYGLRRHGGVGMGIHDGGEWQLKVRSWGLEKGRAGTLEREQQAKRGFFLGEGRVFFCRGVQSFEVSFSLIFFRCVSD
jgi:hypothetical protein